MLVYGYLFIGAKVEKTWPSSSSWTFTLWISWPLSWGISWTFLLNQFSSWVYSVNISWEWQLGSDILEFEDIQFINDGSIGYFHYGSVYYKSDNQEWLSQLIHQYLRLGDSYENKRYKFDKNKPIDSLLSKYFIKFFESNHKLYNSLLSAWWTYTFIWTTTSNNRTVQWTVEYSYQRLGNILIEKPEKTIDGSLFLDAFIWTGITLWE